jgi:lipopolysaccharide heptosyltransferase II
MKMPPAPPTKHPRFDAATQAAWQGARNILLVRLDNLGDVLMTTPALAAIRRSSPEARLTLLAAPVGAALQPPQPLQDDVIVYNAPWHRSEAVVGGRSAESVAEADRQMIELLAQRRFDAAIVFTVCTQSALPAALLCRLAGIPLRLAHCRENPYALLTQWLPDHEVPADGMRHEVARQLALVASVGFEAADPHLVFHVRDTDRQGLQVMAAKAGLDLRRPYVVVHPGASAASRRYPAERFGAAAAAIAAASGCQIVWSGGGGAEEALVETAQCGMARRGVSLAGRLELGELAALIGGARLVVCNNSGPAHIAAALGTPLVVLYALTNPQHTPWHVRARVLSHDVPCRNCLKSVCPAGHHLCLLGVPVEAVAQAALDLLSAAPSQKARPAPAAPLMELDR